MTLYIYIYFVLFAFTISRVRSVYDHHYSIQQQEVALDQFTPSQLGCNVNWVLNNDSVYCEWCDILFFELMKVLTNVYSPSSLYTEEGMKNFTSDVYFDLKGTCFVNWFIATNYVFFAQLIEYSQFSKYRNDDWFVFLTVSCNYEFSSVLFLLFNPILW